MADGHVIEMLHMKSACPFSGSPLWKFGGALQSNQGTVNLRKDYCYCNMS